MDRKTAKNHIGKKVLVNEGSLGQYIATLDEMLSEPNKPWKAIVRIKGIYLYPDFSVEKLELMKPKFKNNELYECSGQKIEAFNEPFPHTFNESLINALKEKWDTIHQINQDTEVELSLIQQELRRLEAEHLIFEASHVYYKLVKKGRDILIYDEGKQETLPLDGCPFEFEIKYNEEWVPAVQINGFIFETESGHEIELKHGSKLRLNKTQFDPYQMLINELEEPSVHALERGLKQLNIGHEHSVYCHNSLLIKMLTTFDDDDLIGVNFISYSNDKHQFVVQHHYERNFSDDAENATYDRFEFTSDTGERVLTTYTTQFSKD